jgi:outer membrane protein assembly factor BamB
VEGGLLYALGSDGDLACLSAADGKVKWKKNLRTDFAGKPGTWAYAESPLIDGGTLVCTPGGSEATMLGLNKATGEVLWKCATPEGDEAAYASAVVTEAGGKRQYVQLLQKGLVGVEANTGKLLWRYAKATSVYNANIPSPLVSGDTVYFGSAGTGGGAVKIKGQDGKIEAEQLYFSPKLPTAIGGSLKIGNYLYGTTAQTMLCVDFATGELKWEDRGIGAAALCYADGRIYAHSEKGEVALIEPSPEGYREKGKFSPPGQPKRKNAMEKAWAYPVVADGKLLIRDHGALWCYDVTRGN